MHNLTTFFYLADNQVDNNTCAQPFLCTDIVMF